MYLISFSAFLNYYLYFSHLVQLLIFLRDGQSHYVLMVTIILVRIFFAIIGSICPNDIALVESICPKN